MTGPRPVNAYIDVEIQYVSGTWYSLGGEIANLEFSRGNNFALSDEFEIGTLSLDIVGPTWSPATNSNVRPGRPIRVKGLDHTSTWQTIWAGTLEVPIVTFNTKNGTQSTRFTAYDVVGRADRAIHNDGLLPSGTLTTQLNAAKVAKNGYRAFTNVQITDTSGVSQSFSTVTATGTPTVLEMVDRVKNNFIQQTSGQNDGQAAVWARRDDPAGFKALGINNVTSNPAGVGVGYYDLYDPARPDAILYTAIDIGHSGEWFRNAVTMNFAAGAVSANYVDLTTTADWDRRDSVQIAMINNTAMSTQVASADYWLQNQPTPTIQARSITFNMMDNRSQLAADRLYSLQDVKFGSIFTGYSNFVRPIRETHRVTPTSWFTTYDVKSTALRTITSPTLVA